MAKTPVLSTGVFAKNPENRDFPDFRGSKVAQGKGQNPAFFAFRLKTAYFWPLRCATFRSAVNRTAKSGTARRPKSAENSLRSSFGPILASALCHFRPLLSGKLATLALPPKSGTRGRPKSVESSLTLTIHTILAFPLCHFSAHSEPCAEKWHIRGPKNRQNVRFAHFLVDFGPADVLLLRELRAAPSASLKSSTRQRPKSTKMFAALTFWSLLASALCQNRQNVRFAHFLVDFGPADAPLLSGKLATLVLPPKSGTSEPPN